MYAKYAAEAENIPAHVEEGLADLDEHDIGLERQALPYDTEFLRPMMPIPLDEQAGLGDTDSESDSSTEVEEEFEVDDDLADTISQVSSPFNFSS